VTDHQDVPSSVDFRNEHHARAWIEDTNVRRPWRPEIFTEFVCQIHEYPKAGLHVLELGSGPGFLAEQILERCPAVIHYTALDFSAPMLRLSRERLTRWPGRVEFVLTDFRESNWMAHVDPPEVVVSIQAIHEVRHKRHVPRLYRQVATILHPGGMLLVCDHVPGSNPSDRDAALFMTQEEQLQALTGAGFTDASLVFAKYDMALYRACQVETERPGT
jgi:SAM-dependent methyltransferase